MTKFRLRFDRSDVMALSALLISFGSLWLSVYELRIMQEEASLMRSQQKASVWPYLDVTASFAYNDQVKITYRVQNKGIGPALVNKITLLENGEVISTDYSAILKKLTTLLDAEGGAEENIQLATGINENVVLSPGEDMILLDLVADRLQGDQKALVQFFRTHTFQVCYSSIYDENWQVKGAGQKPVSVRECTD